MKVRSDEIDRQIEEDSQKFRKECKILLLGSRESGGSTIVKQMKIMHQNGYTREELSAYRLTVYRNLLESAQAIVLAMRELAIDPVLPANRAYIDTILVYKVDPPSSITAASSSVAGANTATATGEFSEEVAAAIDALWSDPIIPKIMDHSSEFYSMNSASYFLSEVRRIGKPGYVPTETDVLHARQKLTGIVETRFNMGQLSIRIVDVCGQRGERRKWIHCFEHVTSIIFCPALSEYDQVLLEESCRTRMVDSLVLFESVINSRWFLRTSIMLFLTEIDVFKSKLLKVPLERYFPEYTGGADIDKAVKYILWRFMQANRARLCIYPHLIQGTDMGNIRLVFAVVKETILHNALKDAGIL
ncbi:G-protein alpha subunit [Fomitiporia mediterranea MF3/22]|uniref:G-protein alpha subunit n=1 Tax=Fomitiporia mediterranea (strain MF3/22) TaxID=694068 RepID=UPI00044080C5|nr:G-protein alpha subunit [Fomitiporia mediterranea MF3/22]EJD08394.1 G-protein alpha subunit [Fomitiporia mediterranea MF3/22]